MKRFIVLLMALPLLLGAVADAHASQRHERFDTGNAKPLALEIKIEASLARDKVGNDKIDPIRCQPNGDSCATPRMYLEMFKRADPGAKLTSVSELPAFLKKLVITDAPKGHFWMACLVNKGGIVAVWNCMSREFHLGEHAWMDPITGAIVLAEDCTNPVGERVPERDCDEIHFWLHQGDEVHIGLLGPDDMPDDVCRPALKKAGSDEWSLALLDTCVRMNCDFSRPAHDLGDIAVRATPRVSFQAERIGEYILRVPRFVEKSSDYFVFCVLWPNGSQSLGTAIGKTAYRGPGWAYIDYPGGDMSSNARAKNGWVGLVHTWQSSEARAFIGARPAPK
jgi:hypothetical protein